MNMNDLNYYEILEISKNASADVIKAAYRTLVKKYHPDVNSENIRNCEECIKVINEAYSILSDPSQKKLYDAKIDNIRQYSQRTYTSSQPTQPNPSYSNSITKKCVYCYTPINSNENVCASCQDVMKLRYEQSLNQK